MQVSASLSRRETIEALKKFENLEENFLDWQRVSVADAKKKLRTSVEASARAKFDYDGNSQLNEKEDQVSLASSYESTVRQLGTGRGAFRSGVQLDVFYDAPHAKALEEGHGAYTIAPKDADALSFLVRTPNNYIDASRSPGSKISAVVNGNRVIMTDGAVVRRKARDGYEFVQDGIINYWRQEAGDVEKDTMKNILKSGFKIR